MSNGLHHYHVETAWTGDQGRGTASYAGYSRDHVLAAPGKPPILGSSDPKFRGDPSRWNPEEMLLASLSACHQLWYLHLCSAARVVVTEYMDEAEGWMTESPDGGGQFTRVLLKPRVTVQEGSDPNRAMELHAQAHALCFIARSMNFPVEHAPEVLVTSPIDRVTDVLRG
jgi:organic hydroperoxide reductase OsmC/OhrA